MQITLELAEDIAEGLKRSGMILLVRLSKAWRSKHIGRMPSLLHSRRLLPFETRMEVDAFLKEREIFDYFLAARSHIIPIFCGLWA